MFERFLPCTTASEYLVAWVLFTVNVLLGGLVSGLIFVAVSPLFYHDV